MALSFGNVSRARPRRAARTRSCPIRPACDGTPEIFSASPPEMSKGACPYGSISLASGGRALHRRAQARRAIRRDKNSPWADVGAGLLLRSAVRRRQEPELKTSATNLGALVGAREVPRWLFPRPHARPSPKLC